MKLMVHEFEPNILLTEHLRIKYTSLREIVYLIRPELGNGYYWKSCSKTTTNLSLRTEIIWQPSAAETIK